MPTPSSEPPADVRVQDRILPYTTMPSIDIVITNKLGLHARAAAKLTQTAGRFQSEVYIARGPQRVNAKSIMGVMMLAAGLGVTVTVDAEGPDADAALEEIRRLFENKFGEQE